MYVFLLVTAKGEGGRAWCASLSPFLLPFLLPADRAAGTPVHEKSEKQRPCDRSEIRNGWRSATAIYRNTHQQTHGHDDGHPFAVQPWLHRVQENEIACADASAVIFCVFPFYPFAHFWSVQRGRDGRRVRLMRPSLSPSSSSSSFHPQWGMYHMS